jgi:hypothetical protein
MIDDSIYGESLKRWHVSVVETTRAGYDRRHGSEPERECRRIDPTAAPKGAPGAGERLEPFQRAYATHREDA